MNPTHRPRPPSKAVKIRIKRAQSDVFATDTVTALAASFGRVELIRITPPKAFVLFAEQASAIAAVRSLNNVVRPEFAGQRVYAEFVPEDPASLGHDSSTHIAPAVAATAAPFEGLVVVPNFLTEAEEQLLLDRFDSPALWLAQITRRTQHFGYAYDYAIQGSEFDKPLEAFPPIIGGLVDRLLGSQHIRARPNQATLQEYTPGQGIPPHIDTVWAFGEEITSLSLLAGSVMRFRPVFTVGVAPETAVDVEFPRRALLLMTGDARYKWSHAILARKHDKVGGEIVKRGRRLSFTFRTVLPSAAPSPSAGRDTDAASPIVETPSPC